MHSPCIIDGPINGIMLRLLEYMHQEADHQITIAEDPDGILGDKLLLDKLSKALQRILKHKALGFIVGMPGAAISSSLDDLHTICIQDHKATCGMPFLGYYIILYMNSLSWDRMCLW